MAAPGRSSLEQALGELVHAFETLTPAGVHALAVRYAEDAVFKDPFNDVRGRPAIARIYAHLFDQVDTPSFRVLQQTLGDADAFLTWEMDWGPSGGAGPRGRIRGATHLRFDHAGRVAWHRDYWDPAEELYERIPVFGALLRWLRRRLAAPQS